MSLDIVASLASESVVTIMAGLISAVLGLVTSLLSSFYRKQQKEKEDEIESIAEKAKSQVLKVKKTDDFSSGEVAGCGMAAGGRAGLNRSSELGRGVNETLNYDGRVIQDLVKGYHHQALAQAKVQFWFSVVAATVGFVLIIYKAALISPDVFSSYMQIMPGVVIDGVALLFFKQSEQTRERATALYDRLRSDNQMLKSQCLVESIENKDISAVVKAQIALHLAGLDPKEIDLYSILNVDKL
ncbi:TRADD-N-associated membrane domain-containing protein [Maridesulfovibrio frigidus]|uniref:TRADD-N-associated membrane domain-containing protein n=1 Tax=Maridesulfovibrio frigidus TaxID=340956 RepID=UPI00068C0E98|nr:hypothetical protein [Maridesulfovibrio frigidus]